MTRLGGRYVSKWNWMLGLITSTILNLLACLYAVLLRVSTPGRSSILLRHTSSGRSDLSMLQGTHAGTMLLMWSCSGLCIAPVATYPPFLYTLIRCTATRWSACHLSFSALPQYAQHPPYMPRTTSRCFLLRFTVSDQARVVIQLSCPATLGHSHATSVR